MVEAVKPQDRRAKYKVVVPHSHFGGDADEADRQARLAFARRLQGDSKEKVTSALDRLRTQWQKRAERKEQAGCHKEGENIPRSPGGSQDRVRPPASPQHGQGLGSGQRPDRLAETKAGDPTSATHPS